MSSINRDPSWADAALDAEGRALLRAALLSPPSRRPTAQDWGRYFDGRTSGGGGGTVSGEQHGAADNDAATGRGRRRDASGAWRQVDLGRWDLTRSPGRAPSAAADRPD